MAHRPRLKANSHRWDCHGNKKARKWCMYHTPFLLWCPTPAIH
jgi:hypothetical protein